ncbi:MAG: ParB/RepB/Spo0J family partition protein [Lachnospiraceae bacterium]|nr:ParB/RepB/Spo0J family partition protein [Lachnospiraceae bacterium]
MGIKIGSAAKVKINSFDDLFGMDESREAQGLSEIREIPLDEIDSFPGHPFQVLVNEDMAQLVESIQQNGVMTPATVRQKEDGRYELISGHRRKLACELAGLLTMRCEVKELSNDDAIIAMVESNLQRSEILPSEKAFAYKMRLEAMSRQGKRTDLTLSPMGTKLRSDSELAEKVGVSRNQIQRYIRLTELIPDLLQLVDDKRMGFRPAVEVSYLTKEEQNWLLDAMERTDCSPTIAQAGKLKEVSKQGGLTENRIFLILQEQEKEKSAFRDKRITELIPKSIPKGQETDYVIKALEFYNKRLEASEGKEGQ